MLNAALEFLLCAEATATSGSELFGLKPTTLSSRMKALKIRGPTGQKKTVTA
jgi:hypothetical protein